MYIPAHFEVSDSAEKFSFIEENAFGQLVSTVRGRLFATNMPFLVSSDKTRLLGHIARQNPQHSELAGQEVLVTLQGPHDYISPSWCSTPGVPTWNYQALHVYGKCTLFDDPARLKELVDTLTHKYEAGFEDPWMPDYKSSMLGAIVGVEIAISEVQCKFKLSQNRSLQDRQQVIDQLEAIGSTDLAKVMKRHS